MKIKLKDNTELEVTDNSIATTITAELKTTDRN